RSEQQESIQRQREGAAKHTKAKMMGSQHGKQNSLKSEAMFSGGLRGRASCDYRAAPRAAAKTSMIEQELLRVEQDPQRVLSGFEPVAAGREVFFHDLDLIPLRLAAECEQVKFFNNLFG